MAENGVSAIARRIALEPNTVQIRTLTLVTGYINLLNQADVGRIGTTKSEGWEL